MSDDSKVREQFEAWYCGDRSALSESDCWLAWQASRAAALEEAAEVCDDESAEWDAQVEAAGKLSSITKHAVESTAVGARRCARRVRALLAPPAGGAR